MRTLPVCACGKKLHRKDNTQCRDCWSKRGTDKTPEQKVKHIGKCGHEVSAIGVEYCLACYHSRRIMHTVSAAVTTTQDQVVFDALRMGPLSLEDVASKATLTQGQALDVLLALQAKGANIYQIGQRWSLERHVPIVERTFEYISRPDNTYHFGIASDQHLCSRYAREDVLGDLYDSFQRAGVDRVFNAGNWIDGEDEKNRFDLEVHGFEPQVKYCVEKYPQRDGITTYAVWGEDHEGWYARREAIDVGRFTEGQMRQAGREDWVDLGFVEARVDLINANTGAKQTLVVMHPGGGSSYAYSYRPQKIVESFSGGEKPAVLVIGHYHKISCNPVRNVWTIQAGCSEDQTVFMRKKGLEAHIGGHIVTIEQDPATGAIFRCVDDARMYFDRAYYNDRWSKTRPVVQAPRFLGGVIPVR